MADEFAFTAPSTKYDPNAYYVATVDSKGHYERRQVRFPPDVWNRLSAVAGDKSNPFRSPDDYVRNAVIHQLNRDASLDDADPVFVRHVAEITANAILESELVIAEQRKKLLSNAKKIAELAATAPPAEKDRLIALLRIQTIGVSDDVKYEIGDLVRRYEK